MSSPRASPLPQRKVPVSHHRKKHIKIGMSRKQYSVLGLSGANSEKEYVESVEDSYWSGDVRLRVPNERRELSAFTADVMRVANILTLKDETRPVGGFKFRVFRFWGDIDFMERVHSGPSLESACRHIVARLQLMGQRIRLSNIIEPGRIFFSELKAGLDKAYQVHGLGHYEYDPVSNEDRLVQYRPGDLRSSIERLHADGWLDDAETASLIGMIHPVGGCTFQEHDKLRRAVRNHYVLRWTLDELLCGLKKLPKGRTITLVEALKIPTLTKCDLFALVDGRYIEVSNNFFLTYSNEDTVGNAMVTHGNEPIPPNVHLISEELPEYISAVHLDINHFIESSHSMKAAKRMWVLAQWEYSLLHDVQGKAKVTQEEKVLANRMNTLAPLFSSRAAALGQVLTDCKTLQEMLQRYQDVPLEPVVRHVLRLWKQTLNNIPYSQYDHILSIQQPVFLAFDGEVRATGAAGERTRAVVLEALAHLEPILEKDVEDFARSFLIANNLLPSFRSYELPRTLSVRNTDLVNPDPKVPHEQLADDYHDHEHSHHDHHEYHDHHDRDHEQDRDYSHEHEHRSPPPPSPPPTPASVTAAAAPTSATTAGKDASATSPGSRSSMRSGSLQQRRPSATSRTRSVAVPVDAHFTDEAALDVQESERLQPGEQTPRHVHFDGPAAGADAGSHGRHSSTRSPSSSIEHSVRRPMAIIGTSAASSAPTGTNGAALLPLPRGGGGAAFDLAALPPKPLPQIVVMQGAAGARTLEDPVDVDVFAASLVERLFVDQRVDAHAQGGKDDTKKNGADGGAAVPAVVVTTDGAETPAAPARAVPRRPARGISEVL